jgi:protein-disulfide isomerase
MPPVPKPPSAKKSVNRNVVIAIVVAAVVAVALIVGSVVLTRGGGNNDASPATTGSSGSVAGPVALVAGIPQSGTTLGNPQAATKMLVYEDLQCPYCRKFTDDGALPAIIDEYVKPGRLKLDWRGLAFLGPDSTKALEIALAAGKQNKLWEVIGLFYEKQGTENSGWVTDQVVDDVLASVPGLDAAKVKADAKSPEVQKQIAAIQDEAKVNKVGGTPSFFIVRGVNQPYQLQVALTPEAFRPAINDALKG